ncbi:MAG: hypothetical protein LGB78_01695 [Sulfurovum sp.]|nr:hypothetical protein [Sulfurovum sp.]MCB4764675.1 hypothetical protein [Sulfurovum sp.]MCB4765953.1 hypothetical protein [Sulfurovum sp.]
MKIIGLILAMVVFEGCSQTQVTKVKSSKKKINYMPIKFHKAPPAVKKEENIVYIGDTPVELKGPKQEDIEKYQRDQAQMSDWGKMMQAREKRHTRKPYF